jgi:Zn ribbon nucleic-acid-binding protein
MNTPIHDRKNTAKAPDCASSDKAEEQRLDGGMLCQCTSRAHARRQRQRQVQQHGEHGGLELGLLGQLGVMGVVPR